MEIFTITSECITFLGLPGILSGLSNERYISAVKDPYMKRLHAYVFVRAWGCAHYKPKTDRQKKRKK